jgi:hypothetical protein
VATVMLTMKVLFVCSLPLVIVGDIVLNNAGGANSGMGIFVPVLFYVLVGVIMLCIDMLLVTFATGVIFGLGELIDTLIGTDIPRLQHLLTLEEVYAKAQDMANVINKIDSQMVGNVAFAAMGVGGFLGGGMARRHSANQEWVRLAGVERRLLAGERIWVND